MSRKATAIAPSNIAFIKYWGTRDVEKTTPYNPSISMTLSECISRCSVEYLPEATGNEILLLEGGESRPAPVAFAGGVDRHLRRLLDWSRKAGGFRVVTGNSFPTGAGMASSASGFTALTLATAAALGMTIDTAEASVLARSSGSGSAARSVIGGYVEWPGEGLEGPAVQIAPAEHWPLSDVVAVVSSSPKEVSSLEGHQRAPGSPLWPSRLEALPDRLEKVRAAIAERDIDLLGPVIEAEALELHMVAMSSRPPIFYWTAGTIAVLRRVREMRQEGLDAYSTIDAGPNVHVICPSEQESEVATVLRAMDATESVIVDRVGEGPVLTEEHLV